MNMRAAAYFIPVVAVVCLSTGAFAAHPLITDDAGTQGKGRFQLEVNGAYASNSDNGVVIRDAELSAALTYGIADTIDATVGLPYHFISVKADGETLRENGSGDMDVYLKWRFHETDGFSLALKPGITLPTGSEDKGLGAGRVNASLFFIVTKELKPLTFHLNLGYIRNENDLAESKDLWHASLAAEAGMSRDLRLVGNVGIERSTGPASGAHSAFILGGLIYSVTEDFDLDAGIKIGLNRAEADYQVLAGLACRFR